MSWFSLILSEKPIIEHQYMINDILTGNMAGQMIMDKAIKPNKTYLAVRSVAADFFTKKLSSPLDNYNKDVAEKILESLVETALPKLLPNLFNQLHNLASESDKPISTDDLNASRDAAFLSLTGVERLVQIFFEKFFSQDAIKLAEHLKTTLLHKSDLTKHINNAIIKNLSPIAQKAVHESIINIIQTGIEETVDYFAERSVTAICMPVIYSFAINAIQGLTCLCNDNVVVKTINFSAQSLPSISSVLWLSTAYHTAALANQFWKAKNAARQTTDLDKEKVKKMAYGLSKEQIRNALEEIHLFRALKITLRESEIEALITLLISHFIDFYWDDLHRVSAVGLPLVN